MNFLARLTLGQPAVCPRAIWTLTRAKSLCLCAFFHPELISKDFGPAHYELAWKRPCQRLLDGKSSQLKGKALFVLKASSGKLWHEIWICDSELICAVEFLVIPGGSREILYTPPPPLPHFCPEGVFKGKEEGF